MTIGSASQWQSDKKTHTCTVARIRKMASRTPDQFMLDAVTGNAVGQKKSSDVLTSQLSEICVPSHTVIKEIV